MLLFSQKETAMKKLLFFLLLTGSAGTASAQHKKPVPPLVPPPKPMPQATVKAQDNPAEKQIAAAHPPLAFAWALDADTVVPPGTGYHKTIELESSRATLRIRSSKDSLRLYRKQGAAAAESRIAHGYLLESRFYDMTIEKNRATLTNRKTGEKMRFKIFLNKLNKAQTQITRLQDLETKAIFEPTAFEGPTIMMGH